MRSTSAGTVRIEAIEHDRAAIARGVLEDLPEWFGIPASLEAYVAAVEGLPVFAAYSGDKTVGFIAIKRHTPRAAEAYVLGVKRAWHRRGAGRALFSAAEAALARDGVRYLTVKTLAASHGDRNYAATRRFYEAIGFEALEEFPTLWGAGTPCLLMLKAIADEGD